MSWSNSTKLVKNNFGTIFSNIFLLDHSQTTNNSSFVSRKHNCLMETIKYSSSTCKIIYQNYLQPMVGWWSSTVSWGTCACQTLMLLYVRWPAAGARLCPPVWCRGARYVRDMSYQAMISVIKHLINHIINLIISSNISPLLSIITKRFLQLRLSLEDSKSYKPCFIWGGL